MEVMAEEAMVKEGVKLWNGMVTLVVEGMMMIVVVVVVVVKEVHDYHHHIMSCFGPVCFHCFCLLNHHHSMTEMKRRILKRKSLRSLRSLKNLRSLKSLRILRSLRSLKMIKVETRIQ